MRRLPSPVRRYWAFGLQAVVLAVVTLRPVSAEERIARDHGVAVPAPVTPIARRSTDGWGAFHGHTETEAEIPARNLPGLLARFRPEPGYEKHWSVQADGELWYACRASDGRTLRVVVGRRDGDRARLRLVTTWESLEIR